MNKTILSSTLAIALNALNDTAEYYGLKCLFFSGINNPIIQQTVPVFETNSSKCAIHQAMGASFAGNLAVSIIDENNNYQILSALECAIVSEIPLICLYISDSQATAEKKTLMLKNCLELSDIGNALPFIPLTCEQSIVQQVIRQVELAFNYMTPLVLQIDIQEKQKKELSTDKPLSRNPEIFNSFYRNWYQPKHMLRPTTINKFRKRYTKTDYECETNYFRQKLNDLQGHYLD